MEFVNFLKNPDQYLKLGAKIPKVRGILSNWSWEGNNSLYPFLGLFMFYCFCCVDLRRVNSQKGLKLLPIVFPSNIMCVV